MRVSIRNADESSIHVLDGLVLAWLAFWLVMGAWAGYTIWQVSALGDTMSKSGVALGTAGRGLETAAEVPVLGNGIGDLGAEVSATAEEVTARGQEIKGQLRQLSLMLGLSIMLMPTTPVVGLYLPLRQARRSEVEELRRALARHPDDPALDRHLAERALQTLPFADVHRMVGDPWQAISEGRGRQLADAELARLGLRRPRSPSP